MMESNPQSEFRINMEEASKFVNENIVPAKDGRACVDGRYLSIGDSTGFLSRAGGDFGYVMGLLALGINPIQSVDAVYGYINKTGGKFYAHTDIHSEEEKTLTGCGHIARSNNPDFSERYGVNPDDVKQALDYLRDKELHPNIDEVILEGDHAEKGVLIVRGKNKTLRHQANGAQYFVYDKDRDDEFVEKLVADMDMPDITPERLKEALEKQTNATVELLAAGKPVFEVDLGEESPQIKHLFDVPKAA